MNRTPLIAGNWKMYKTGEEAIASAEQLAQLTGSITGPDIMIAPTFLSLPLVSAAVKGSNINIGAQNLHFEKEGAFTGEVSAQMIRSAGADYVIIGHSERRQYFGETNTTTRKKIKAATQVGLKPILCIGETLSQREAKKTFQVLDKQVSDGLKGFGLDELTDLVLAYEPVWAIGTGMTATVEQIAQVHQNLRALIAKLFNDDFAQKLRILYGGSVKPSNVRDIMGIADVDGALVGGASLDAITFFKIISFND